MLHRLHIRNYAIIRELEVEWGSGLTIITGETGAGKSIVLGALSLVLGKRADTSVLHDADGKCVVEAEFRTDGFDLDDFFSINDIDRLSVTILRREVTPDGRSRAFINDTPVNLQQLRALAERLVDVHSQHEVHTLKEAAFRARFLDACADRGAVFKGFEAAFATYENTRQQLEMVEQEAAEARSEEDYIRFQLNELDELNLSGGEMEEMEERLSMLENAGEIRATLSEVNAELSEAERSVTDALREIVASVNRLSRRYSPAAEWAGRLGSTLIELDDLAAEMGRRLTDVDDDPAELERVRERVDAVNRLLLKHRKQTATELIALRSELSTRLCGIERSEEHLNTLRERLFSEKKTMQQAADALTKVRNVTAQRLGPQLASELHVLGMPDARLQIDLVQRDTPTSLGQDDIRILFSANKGQPMQDIAKVASGGELSRLMLTVKAEMASNAELPTVIFDEIDTGVSGEVADRMGDRIRSLGSHMQVICITHLPQIAAKGKQHLFVFKEGNGDRTVTGVRALSGTERITEIAKMLSNDNPSEAAISHASQLLAETQV
jgi:DNA repair protein RecN (Recombination protein N)